MVKKFGPQNQESETYLRVFAHKYALHILGIAASSMTLAFCSMIYSCAHPFITTVSASTNTLQRVGSLEVATADLQRGARDSHRQHSIELSAELRANSKFAAAYGQALRDGIRNEPDSSEKAAKRGLYKDYQEIIGLDRQTYLSPAADPAEKWSALGRHSEHRFASNKGLEP